MHREHVREGRYDGGRSGEDERDGCVTHSDQVFG